MQKFTNGYMVFYPYWFVFCCGPYMQCDMTLFCGSLAHFAGQRCDSNLPYFFYCSFNFVIIAITTQKPAIGLQDGG